MIESELQMGHFLVKDIQVFWISKEIAVGMEWISNKFLNAGTIISIMKMKLNNKGSAVK